MFPAPISRSGCASGMPLALLAGLSLLLLFAPALATTQSGWLPESMPNPWEDPASCSRTVPSWVCDPDGVVPREDQDLIEGVLKQISSGQEPYAKLPCGGLGDVGPQFAVAVVRRMSPSLVTSRGGKEAAARTFAKQIHDGWAVGHAECNDGAVIFLSIEDRRSYISTGAALRKLLPDSAIGEVLERMKPFLRAGRYGEALAQAADDLGNLAAGRRASAGAGASWLEFLPFVAFFAIFAGSSFFAMRESRRKARDFASVKKHLNQISDAQERARLNSYKVSSCPICLEDFDAPAGEESEGTPMEEASQAQQALGPRSRSGNISPGPGSEDQEPLLQQGAEGKSDKPGGANEEGPKREPVALPCGHVFCEECIDEWMKTNTSCPICRKDPTQPDLPPGGGGGGGDDGQPRPPPPPRQSPPQDGVGGCCQPGLSTEPPRRSWRRPYRGGPMRMGMDVGPELLFRLGSLRRRYPAYVTHDMVGRWSDDIRGNRHINWRSDSEFLGRDPARIEATRSHGRSGAHMSFGGGSSSGGGGRGGGW